MVQKLPQWWEDFLRGMTFTEKKTYQDMSEETELTPGISFFYTTRLYGNPGINIDMRLYQVFKEIESHERYSSRKISSSSSWTFLGPSNIAGRMRAITFDPFNPNIVYAGAASGGVFKSTDGGSTWKANMDNAPALPVGALAIDRNNPETIFAGTGEITLPLSRAIAAPAYSGVGVVKSTDGGLNWSRLSWPSQGSAISRILLHQISSDTMLVATRENLYKTTNGGNTWRSNVLTGVISDLRYQEGDQSVVFAAIGNDFGGTTNGVYRSCAGGNAFSWKKLSKNFPSSDSTGRILLATTPADPELLFALVAKPIAAESVSGGVKYSIPEKDFLALMRSTDAGENWERLPTNLPQDFALQQAFYNLCIGLSPKDKNLIFIGGIELYRSTNGGQSFARLTFGNQDVHVDQHVIEFQPVSDNVYLGNDGGIYRSSNLGATWEHLGSSLATVQYYTLAVDQKNPNRIYGGAQDHGILRLLRQTDTTTNWLIIRGDIDGGYIAVDSNFLYSMGTVSIYPFRTTNGGQTWTTMNVGFGTGNRPNWLQPLILHPIDRSRLYTATQYVYEAKDANNPSISPVWKQISQDLTSQSRLYESVISTMAISRSNPDWMYIGTGDGKIQKTTDLGSSSPQWHDISDGIPKRWITRIAVDRTDNLTAYASFSGYGSGHVFKTTDGGVEWRDISGDLPDIPVNSIALSGNHPKTIFVATDLGVWVTYNNGINWERVGIGLPNVVVYDIRIDSSNRLFAATHGRGIWITDAPLSVTGPETVSNFILDQNTPNPVTSNVSNLTTIRFTLPNASNITLDIFDVAGHRMQTLLNGHYGRGKHSVSFNTSEITNGIYFYQLRTENSSITKKMVIMR